jgi:hypothetical protein
MGGPVKTIFVGVILFVIGIILLVSIVLPQMHTGYTYINNTMTEMTGGASIWGVVELLATVSMSLGGLGFMGFGLFQQAKSGGGRKRRGY